jgi:hypothetical protein
LPFLAAAFFRAAFRPTAPRPSDPARPAMASVRSVTHAHFLWSPRVPFASRWDARSVPYMKRVITPSQVIRAENVGNPAADDGVRSGSRIRATRRGVRGYYRLHLNPWARQNFWHAMCWAIRGFFIGKSCSPRTMRARVDSIRWSASRLAGFSLTRRPALTNGSGTMRGIFRDVTPAGHFPLMHTCLKPRAVLRRIRELLPSGSDSVTQATRDPSEGKLVNRL